MPHDNYIGSRREKKVVKVVEEAVLQFWIQFSFSMARRNAWRAGLDRLFLFCAWNINVSRQLGNEVNIPSWYVLFTKLEVTLAGYWLYSYLRFYEPRRSTWRSIKSIYFFHSPLFSTRPSRFSSICYGQPSCFRRSPLRFFRLRNSAWDFLGVNFILIKEFCVGFVESPRDFFSGFDF